MPAHSHKTVLQHCLTYFEGDELAASAWMNKYARKDEQGNFLEKGPDDMHWRMAKEFARIEKKYKRKRSSRFSDYGQARQPLTVERIHELFRNFRYVIPQGSVMAALGNKGVIASLSNCVVLPEVPDSYGGILQADQQMAQLFKRRCGVGVDISSIRPAGMHVSNAARSTSGAVSFMERFSNTTREVAQNGRRGALMITMDIAHPDIESFIVSKQDRTKITGANISVRLSDEFMKSVEQKSKFSLRFPVQGRAKISRNVNAAELWNGIVKCAHSTAEPGLIFWDRQHQYSTSSYYPGFRNVSTNPCSEIAMQGGDSCRLIALNLYSFVKDPFTAKATFDHRKFYEITYEAQRLSDDLVDLELECIERILKKIDQDPETDKIKRVERELWELLYANGKKGRRTGLGFTAMADALAALNLKFDSEVALTEMESIMRTKCRAEFDSSIDLALERGKFHDFDPKIEKRSGFIKMMQREFPGVYKRMMLYGRRNISLSTVAPTGTLSILSQTSSGIEPVFKLEYKRRKKVDANDTHARVDLVDATGDAWQEFGVHHPKLKQWMRITGEKDIRKSPYTGATAEEISWEKRLEIQAIVQKYTTHSISSTINLPHDISREKVGEIYLEAWKKGLKGITVYRSGSRTGVLVSAGEKNDLAAVHAGPPVRPDVLEAEVVRFRNGNEQWMAVVGLLNEKPYEIFTGLEEANFSMPPDVQKGWVKRVVLPGGGKRYDFIYESPSGRKTVEGLSRTFNKEYWNYAKLISGVLRYGMPILNVIELVENLNLYSDNINTWKNGVVRALKKYIPEGSFALESKCPECGDPQGLFYQEGCLQCKSCGYSVCG